MIQEESIRQAYQTLTLYLISHNTSITTMESCTSGLIASLITDTPGASAIFKGAFVTYSNEAKIRQGIPAALISRYGVYSPETARAMATACRHAYLSDIGLGITGTTGNPDPNNADSVPGRVFFAVDLKGFLYSDCVEIASLPTRYAYKLAAADAVVRFLLPLLPVTHR
ncbi:MAG: CinA family protein [Blautia sp.]|nr:CinA family protein [Blautia sp.]